MPPAVCVGVLHQGASLFKHVAGRGGITCSNQIVTGIERRIHLQLSIRGLACSQQRLRVALASLGNRTDVAEHPRTHVDSQQLVSGQTTAASLHHRAIEHSERFAGATARRKRIAMSNVPMHRRVDRGRRVGRDIRARLDDAERQRISPICTLRNAYTDVGGRSRCFRQVAIARVKSSSAAATSPIACRALARITWPWIAAPRRQPARSAQHRVQPRARNPCRSTQRSPQPRGHARPQHARSHVPLDLGCIEMREA